MGVAVVARRAAGFHPLGLVAARSDRRHFGRRAWRGNRDRRKPASRRRAAVGARMSDRWTWHGGSLEAAKSAFGDGDWLDRATGINPQPWPGADRKFHGPRMPAP